MARLAWNEDGERIYYAGLDRGVLYVPSKFGIKAVPWNGLISIDDVVSREVTPYYQDGQKYLIHQVLGEFEGVLRAFTYPDEFEEMNGVRTKNGGLHVHQQQSRNSFGLSYRTKIGDDLEGLDRGYMIHLLYNLQATPDTRVHSTIGDQVSPMSLSWKISSIPSIWGYGYRPTAHLSLKSTDLAPDTLTALENMLYGTSGSNPKLPSLQELVNLIENPPVVTVISDTVTVNSTGTDIELIDDDTYRISGANVAYQGFDTWRFTY